MIYAAHSAFANQGGDFIVAEAAARGNSHVRPMAPRLLRKCFREGKTANVLSHIRRTVSQVSIADGETTVKVRLAKRFARKLESVDSSGAPQSEIVDLPVRGAEALIAEGWAKAVDDAEDDSCVGLHMAPDERAEAADRPRRRSS